jgi:hypothetical protein
VKSTLNGLLTRIKSNKDELCSVTYVGSRRDRSNKVGGGVIVYVKNTVNCTIRPDLHVGSLECIWLEIKLNNKKYLYGTFYIPKDELCSVTYVGSVIS